MTFKIIPLAFSISALLSLFKIDIKQNSEFFNNGKIIYVDVSLNESLKDNDPYLQYVNGDTETKFNLVLDSNFIYHTETSVMLPKNGYYEIHNSTDYVSDKIDSTILGKNNYNYVCAGTDKTIKGYGYFTDRIVNPEASYKTQRVWLNNDNKYFYSNDDWGSPCKNVVGYFDNEDKWQMITMPFVINSFDNKYYYYADIPYYISSVHFMRMAETKNHNYLIYQDVEITTLTYGSCYFAGTASYEEYANVQTGYVDGADSMLLSKVLETFLTYGVNFSNGCASTTVKNIYSTWFEHKSATINDLKNVKILDYSGYTANGDSYEGLEKKSFFTLSEKWDAMCNRAGIDPNTGKTKNMILFWFQGDKGKFFIIVGAVGFVCVLIAIGFSFFKKKKQR